MDAGSLVSGFDVRFKARVGGGNGADGFSFNFASDLPDGGFSEDGAGSGLTIAFDTFNNSVAPVPAEAPAIEVKFGGVSITNKLVSFLRTGSDFVDVSIHVDLDGTLDLVYGTNVVFSNLPAYTTPLTSGRFGFGARTGGSFDNHWLDNLSINTVVTCGSITVEKQGNDTVLTWPGSCALESADNVTGPYNPVAGASSPYPVPITGTQTFFRLHGN